MTIMCLRYLNCTFNIDNFSSGFPLFFSIHCWRFDYDILFRLSFTYRDLIVHNGCYFCYNQRADGVFHFLGL